MKRLIWKILGTVQDRLSGSTKPSSRSSRLMGMYMRQANSMNYFSPDFKMTRERRNGRYAVQRERD